MNGEETDTNGEKPDKSEEDTDTGKGDTDTSEEDTDTSEEDTNQVSEGTPDLEKQRDELLLALEIAKSEQEKAEANVASTQSQIDALTALLNDIRNAKTAYDTEHPALKAKETECGEYLANETKCLEQFLDGRTDDVARIVSECEKKVADAKKAFDEAEDP